MPGITRRPCRLMERVRWAAIARMTPSVPVATMSPPRIATAWTSGLLGSSVVILPL